MNISEFTLNVTEHQSSAYAFVIELNRQRYCLPKKQNHSYCRLCLSAFQFLLKSFLSATAANGSNKNLFIVSSTMLESLSALTFLQNTVHLFFVELSLLNARTLLLCSLILQELMRLYQPLRSTSISSVTFLYTRSFFAYSPSFARFLSLSAT